MMFPVAILDSISKLRILCCWHQGLGQFEICQVSASLIDYDYEGESEADAS